MNIWKRLRHKINIPTSEIAELLHISEEKYLEIENDTRRMPKKLINPFMKIYNNRKEIKGTIEIKMFEVNQFLKTMDLKELRKEFNYKSNKELAKAIGIGEAMIYRLNKVDKLSKNTKLKVYNFFNDPLNINIDNETLADYRKENQTIFNSRLTKCDTIEIAKRAIKELNCNQTELAKMLNMTPGTICRYVSGETTMSRELKNEILSLIKKRNDEEQNKSENGLVNEFICECEKDNEDINDIVSDVQEPNVEENDTIQTLRELVDEIYREKVELQRRLSRYEKLIDRL